MNLFRDGLAKYMAVKHPALRKSLTDGKLSDDQQARLKTHIASFKREFLLEHPNKKQESDVAHAAEQTTSPDQSEAEKGQE